MEEPELIFHDTVPLPEEQIGEAREMARKQTEWVLYFFKYHSGGKFTPNEVHKMLVDAYNQKVLLTSVRRSITNLTKENRLIKCQWNEGRQGAYGKYNRTWRYNTEYIKPLNPKK